MIKNESFLKFLNIQDGILTITQAFLYLLQICKHHFSEQTASLQKTMSPIFKVMHASFEECSLFPQISYIFSKVFILQ